MGDYGFEGAGEFGGQDENFNCQLTDEEKAKFKADLTVMLARPRPTKPAPQKTTYESSFTVFPDHTNYNVPPSVFGGKMLAEMDNAAAMCVRRILYGTDCTDAVTVGVSNVAFYRPAYIGEIIHLRAWLNGLGRKSITVIVECDRENKYGEIHAMAKGTFTFVARSNGMPSPHGLEMP